MCGFSLQSLLAAFFAFAARAGRATTRALALQQETTQWRKRRHRRMRALLVSCEHTQLLQTDSLNAILTKLSDSGDLRMLKMIRDKSIFIRDRLPEMFFSIFLRTGLESRVIAAIRWVLLIAYLHID